MYINTISAAGDTMSTKNVTNVAVVQPVIIPHLYCKQVVYKQY